MATRTDAPLETEDDEPITDLNAWMDGREEEELADIVDGEETDGAPEAEAEAPADADQPEPEAEAGEADSAEVQPAPEAEAQPSAEAAPAGTTPEAEPGKPELLPEPFAFAFKADEKEFTVPIPGAHVWKMPDGQEVVSAPKAALESAFRRQLAPHLADRSHWRNRTLELQKQVEQAKAGTDVSTEPVVVKANAALDIIGKLLDSDLTSAEGQDAALNELYKWQQERPVWEERQKTAALEKRVAAVGEAGKDLALEPEPWEVERQQEVFHGALMKDLESHAADLLRDPELAKLDKDTVAKVWQEVAARPNDFFVEVADDEDPRFKKGEIVCLLGELKKPFLRELDVARRVEQARQDALATVQPKIDQVTAVAKENAKVLGSAAAPARTPNTAKPKPPAKTRERPTPDDIYAALEREMAEV